MQLTDKAKDAVSFLRTIARRIEQGEGYSVELKKLIPLIDPEGVIVRLNA